MLKDGYLPAVTIHAVDCGVDTGPVILRRQLDIDPKVGVKAIVEAVMDLRIKLLLESLDLIKQGS